MQKNVIKQLSTTEEYSISFERLCFQSLLLCLSENIFLVTLPTKAQLKSVVSLKTNTRDKTTKEFEEHYLELIKDTVKEDTFIQSQLVIQYFVTFQHIFAAQHKLSRMSRIINDI